MVSRFVKLLCWYYQAMYLREQRKKPQQTVEQLDEFARYQVTFLLLLPVASVVILLTFGLLKLEWFPFPGMSFGASKWIVVLVIGVAAIVVVSRYVRGLGLREASVTSDTSRCEGTRARWRVEFIFWGAFALSLGIPLAVVALAS